jgi:hypothetical protein
LRLELSKSFVKKLKSRIEKYEFEVGVLDDRPHYEPKMEQSSYAGGPVLKKSRIKSPLSTGEVLVENQQRLGINLLSRPFQEKNSDILKFTKAFLQLVTGGKASIKRVENLLQAIVRNPILNEEYGSNKSATADAKGFDRHLFATGQMFRAILARAKRVRKTT